MEFGANMRVSQGRREYIENIGLIFLEESEAFVWQNNNGQKLLSPVLIKDIVPEKNDLILMPREASFPQYDLSKDLYFKANFKEMLFKSSPKKYHFSPSEIILPFPDQVFYLELRQHRRFLVPVSRELLAEIRPHPQDEAEKDLRIQLQIRNISSKGIGLIAKFQESYSVDHKRSFKVHRIGRVHLDPPLGTKLIYKNLVKSLKKHSGVLLIGLEFDKALPQATLVSSLREVS